MKPIPFFRFTFIMWVVVVLALFSSCEDVIDVDVDSLGPQFAIDAVITHEAKPQFIRVSKSIPYFDNSGRFPGVAGMDVVMTDNLGNRYVFDYYADTTEDGIYRFDPGSASPFEIGRVYTLDVRDQQDTFRAICDLNRATPVDSITYTFFENDTISGYVIFIHAVDLPGATDHYWIRTFRNNRLMLKPNQINVTVNASGPGANSDGIPLIFPVAFLVPNDFANPFQLNDTVRVEIMGITRAFHDYMAEVSRQSQNAGLFATPPVNPRSNIKAVSKNTKKPLGFFVIGDIQSLEIVIQE
jgi:hypothetical protein